MRVRIRSAIDITRLRQQKLLLQEKLDTVRNLDEDILTVVSEGQMDEEISEAGEFVEFTQLARMRIDAALTTSQLSTQSKSSYTLPEMSNWLRKHILVLLHCLKMSRSLQKHILVLLHCIKMCGWLGKHILLT